MNILRPKCIFFKSYPTLSVCMQLNDFTYPNLT